MGELIPMHQIVLADNPSVWPAYDPAFVRLLVYDPKHPHPAPGFVKRAFDTIDADRWYLVANVYGHPSMRNERSGVERYETVHGIPRPRRGVRGYFQVRNQSQRDRTWDKGMTYTFTSEESSAIPIGEPVPISIEDAYRHWQQIRSRLRLTEQAMERKGMPKPRRHVIDGKPWWWNAQTGSVTSLRPVDTVAERVTSFRQLARARR